MSNDQSTDFGTDDSLDRIAEDLQRLRQNYADVSYAEIAHRIAQHRLARGVPPAAAQPARTTVYDVFRSGRSRMNAELVGEIVRALGASETESAQWVARCRAAIENRGPQPAKPAQPADTAKQRADYPKLRIPSFFAHARARITPTLRQAGVLMLVGVGLNWLGFFAVGWLHLPLYFDMAGTAIAAVILGPWYGALVGLVSNAAGASIYGTIALPFALVNVVGALAWGYGARCAFFQRSISRYFALNILVALACTGTALPVLVLFFGGGTGHATDTMTHTLTTMGEPAMLAVLQSNLFTSVVDKLLAGFIALAIGDALRTRLSQNARENTDQNPHTWIASGPVVNRPRTVQLLRRPKLAL
jgi:energy-coupling factor transport system substrate-specific component